MGSHRSPVEEATSEAFWAGGEYGSFRTTVATIGISKLYRPVFRRSHRRYRTSPYRVSTLIFSRLCNQLFGREEGGKKLH